MSPTGETPAAEPKQWWTLAEVRASYYEGYRDAVKNMNDPNIGEETPAAEPTVLDEWKQAIIDGLVVAEIYRNEHEIAPKRALNELIAWHCQIASSAMGPTLREQIEQLEKWAAMEYAPCHYNADAADGWADGYWSAIGAVLALLDAAKER